MMPFFDAITNRGLIVTDDKRSTALSGVLVELQPDAQDPTLYSMDVGVLVPLRGVGVSAIQISSNTEALPQWKFFGGTPTNGFATSKYKGELWYSQILVGSTTDLELKNGYNAMSDLNHEIAGGCTTTTTSITTTSTSFSSTTTTTTATSSTTTLSTTTTSQTTTTTTTSMTTTFSTTTLSTTTTTTPVPVAVIVVFQAECTADTNVDAIAAATFQAIATLLGADLLRGDILPSGSCGSIVVEVTAVSADAADAINAAISNGLLVVTMADGTELTATVMTIASCNDAGSTPRARRATGGSDAGDGCEGGGLAASHVSLIVVGTLVVLLFSIAIVWYRRQTQSDESASENVEMGDFDDNVEVGKMTKNPLHASSATSHETAFSGTAETKTIVSLKDVWGTDGDGNDMYVCSNCGNQQEAGSAFCNSCGEAVVAATKPVIRRDSLFEIWGVDEHPPDLDTDQQQEGSIMLSGPLPGRRQSLSLHADVMVESDMEDEEDEQPPSADYLRVDGAAEELNPQVGRTLTVHRASAAANVNVAPASTAEELHPQMGQTLTVRRAPAAASVTGPLASTADYLDVGDGSGGGSLKDVWGLDGDGDDTGGVGGSASVTTITKPDNWW